MAKGKTARNVKNEDESSLRPEKNSKAIIGDNVDTNKPQAEEKDLEDLLKDIELQYEEEESKRKNRKKKKRTEIANEGETDEVAVVEEKPEKQEKRKLTRAEKALRSEKQTKHPKEDNSVDTPAKENDISNKQKPKQTKDDFKTKESQKLKIKKEPVSHEGNKNAKAKKDETNKVAVTPAADDLKNKQKPKSKKEDAKARQIEMIKLALAKQKEMEEQMIKAEEEQIKREEQREEARLAKLEEEKLKRQRKKEREKARIQRKKEAGTFLTKEQREKKERALLQLKLSGALPAEGLPVRPETKKRKKKDAEEIEEETEIISVPVVETVEPVKVEDDGIKDCWDDESEEETSVKGSAVPVDHQSSSDEESSIYDSDSDDEDIQNLPPREKALTRIERRRNRALQCIDYNDLRCPVICVMGHVDTGKTKMLDNLRRTHVQDSEAGGITQQIGATNVPQQTIIERTKHCAKDDIRIPGFMFIDTPGHESFKNLRVRGSSLCDIAILIVDIMHGLEPQTIESLTLLRNRRCPFIIALNKIDRLNSWKSDPLMPIEKLLKQQELYTTNDFEKRYKQIIVQLAEQKVNAALFYENPDVKSFYPMIPVSAVSGDGIGDLMYSIVDVCQNALSSKIAFIDDLKCTVMEVKTIEGFGTTIDICLVNGRLHVGDTIIVPGTEGPIVTQIRGLLMPAHNKDLRVKNQYQIYKEVKGTRGVKIAAKNLEKSMAGLPLYVAVKDDEIQIYQDELKTQLHSVLNSFATQDVGVYVQASTLGSLEALIAFLNSSKIPFSGLNIGPVHRNDVTRASIMLERDSQWAVILAFDVRVDKEVQDVADNVGVRIFKADIIYHLFDKFMAYRDELKAANKEKNKNLAVFPCMMKMMPQFVFNTRDPIVVGVMVERGFVKMGTPLCVIKNEEIVDIGRVSGIEFNHKTIDIGRAGQEICLKIESIPGETPKMLGRHFDISDTLISKVSRTSIDVVKEHFRDEMQKADWQLIIDLKNQLKII